MRFGLLACIGFVSIVSQVAAAERPQVAAYYFPNYHPGDARNVKRYGADWSEWDLVKAAKPRFDGHHEPNVPAWGEADESDPKQMAVKIDAAADHGVDAFVFDWYFYNDGPFLEAGLEKGFLHAANRSRMKFAIMWANHDWQEIFPAKPGGKYETLYPGKITPATWDRMTDHIVADYFKDPSYWMVDGKPYFSVYDLGNFVRNFGSIEATRKAMDDFRHKAVAAGLKGIDFNAVVWSMSLLPAEGSKMTSRQAVAELGFDSISSYVWVHHSDLPKFPDNDYAAFEKGYVDYWDRTATGPMPLYLNVTMGWDPTPRTNQSMKWSRGSYPYTPVVTGNTPERFRHALEQAKTRADKLPAGRRVVLLNAWNEWTEGSYLEPDTVHGTAYLDAVKDVFGLK